MDCLPLGALSPAGAVPGCEDHLPALPLSHWPGEGLDDRGTTSSPNGRFLSLRQLPVSGGPTACQCSSAVLSISSFGCRWVKRHWAGHRNPQALVANDIWRPVPWAFPDLLHNVNYYQHYYRSRHHYVPRLRHSAPLDWSTLVPRTGFGSHASAGQGVQVPWKSATANAESYGEGECLDG
jgi:hypothetical protein